MTGNETNISKFRAGMIVLCVIFCAAFIVRFRGLDRLSLWGDEAYRAQELTKGFSFLVTLPVVSDEHPPLWHFITWAHTRLFGMSEVSLRAAPALFGLICVGLVYVLVREVGGSKSVGLLAAGMLALNPMHVWYSRYFREYAFESAALVFATLFFVRAVRSRRFGDWVGFVAGLLCALYVHEAALFYATVFGVALLWLGIARPQRRREAVIVLGTLAIACVPLAVLILANRSVIPNWFQMQGVSVSVSEIVIMLLRAPFRFLAGGITLSLADRTWLPYLLAKIALVVAVLAWVVVGLTGRLARRRADAERRWQILLLFGLVVVPLAIEALAAGFGMFPFELRHCLAAAPIGLALFVLLAEPLATARRRVLMGATVALYVLAVAMPMGTILVRPVEQEPWREVAAYVDSRIADGECVVISDAWTANHYQFYADHADRENPVFGFPCDWVWSRDWPERTFLSEARLTEVAGELADRLQGSAGVWYVRCRSETADPKDKLFAAFSGRFAYAKCRRFEGLYRSIRIDHFRNRAVAEVVMGQAEGERR